MYLRTSPKINDEFKAPVADDSINSANYTYSGSDANENPVSVSFTLLTSDFP